MTPTRPGIVPALVDSNYHDRSHRESLDVGGAVILAVTFGSITLAVFIAGLVVGAVFL